MKLTPENPKKDTPERVKTAEIAITDTDKEIKQKYL